MAHTRLGLVESILSVSICQNSIKKLGGSTAAQVPETVASGFSVKMSTVKALLVMGQHKQ